ncbi:protein of unknown function (plasmid) [Cupriavidus taiwanensis]|uniref:Uncharacterized protein n=1 Tax=Cupriavidus taiwanensis TaxID=164546 RepID=A0A9Q7UZ74_9BURK|nr:protein of unknown function [Cupriavidus taiwanensis]
MLYRLLPQLRAGDVVVLRAPQRPHALLIPLPAGLVLRN